MRVLALLLLLAAPAFAAEPWVLQSGPRAVESVPAPPQNVPAWYGQYSDGVDDVFIYATSSTWLILPPTDGRRIAGTPWSVVAQFPAAWSAAVRSAWLDRWIAEFRTLASLPDPGWPIVFPSILTKG